MKPLRSSVYARSGDAAEVTTYDTLEEYLEEVEANGSIVFLK